MGQNEDWHSTFSIFHADSAKDWVIKEQCPITLALELTQLTCVEIQGVNTPHGSRGEAYDTKSAGFNLRMSVANTLITSKFCVFCVKQNIIGTQISRTNAEVPGTQLF